MGFNVILAIPFGYVGLAMATALSGVMNAVLLYRRLAYLNVYKIPKDTWWFLVKIVSASIIMTAAVFYYSSNLRWIESSFAQRAEYLSITIGIGALSYFAAILVFGVRPHQLIGKK